MNICIILTCEKPVVSGLIKYVPDPLDPWKPCETHKRTNVAPVHSHALVPLFILFAWPGCPLLPSLTHVLLQLLLWIATFLDAFFYFFSLRQN